MFVLECLNAKFGDCLIIRYGKTNAQKLVLIDGGPAGTYKARLKGRLRELRDQNPAGGPLPIELGMVSHIDGDHITGILDLFKEVQKTQDPDERIVEFKKFWHNSLAHLVADANVASTTASQDVLTASLGDIVAAAADEADHNDGRAEKIIATVKQGDDLASLLVKLGLQENTPFSGPVKSGRDPILLSGDLSLDVIWPDEGALSNLKTEWKAKTTAVEIAAYLDKSVANLSSIAAVVTHKGKSILLTGDARGDDLLKGLKSAGYIKNGTCKFNVLKMPHHGSDRNMETDFLAIVLADTYVFSADGKHDNPDAATLEMLMKARPKGGYTVVLTNKPVMETKSRQKGFDETLKKLRKQPGVEVIIRGKNNAAVEVVLA